MRSSTGDMMIDPKDPRRMIKADTSKGERGTHRVYIEGKDDDGSLLVNRRLRLEYTRLPVRRAIGARRPRRMA